MSRIVGALFIGLAAGFLAHGMGIPLWRDWVPGDAADIALLAGYGSYLITGRQQS